MSITQGESAPRRYYAGSEWLASNLKYMGITPSPHGLRVADLLGELAHGLYHISEAVHSSGTDWTDPRYVRVCLRPAYINLCTVDRNFLTRLVFLAHDYGMRVEIDPHTFHHFTLAFWQREARTGSYSERCPTLEQAVEEYRASYAAPEAL